MVDFGTGYFHPMDRDYGHSSLADNSTNDIGIGIKDLGFSTGLGPTPNIPAVAAIMRTGMKTMELSFMGAGKGNGQAHSPGMYGERQRQALRELQEANQFNFTTHASVNIMGLAGMDQQGNFTKGNKKRSLQEIQRAIDFASDVARGGPVVVHTGEYLRPIADAKWNQQGEFANKFEMHEEEEKQAAYRVLDVRTGRLIEEARKGRKVSRPVWNTAKPGQKYKDRFGNEKYANAGEIIYLDYWGKQLDRSERVPVYDNDAGHFEVTQMDWEDLEEEAKEMTNELKQQFEDFKKGKITERSEEFKNSIWRERILKAKQENISSDKLEVLPEEAYIIARLETQAANSRGYAKYYSGDFSSLVNRHEELTSDIEQAKKAIKEGGKSEISIAQEDLQRKQMELNEIKRRIEQARESSASQYAQAEEVVEQIRYLQSANSYALNESFDSYARAGISAMEKSNLLEKKGQLKKPIAVAMENLFPESYGAHPDELKNLIKGSRERMVQMLVKNNKIERQQAEKEAKEHIFATFDTAHCGLWWKYWKGDEKKTLEDNRKDFNKWMIKKVEELAKDDIVGHIHLVDTMGYEDEHLAPGEGLVPVKELIKKFKENGFKGEIIVEPGADFTTDTSGTQTLLKAWTHFGSPIYGSSFPESRRGWGNVQYRHFGQNEPPYFIFGPYSPSEDWTLWSGVPLE